MSKKSILVPQPEFSNWIIQERQKLNLTSTCLLEKINYKISDRTLKYLEDSKTNSFSEYTLVFLAEGLELSFPELQKKIEELNVDKNRIHSKNIFQYFKKNIFLFALLSILILLFLLIFGDLIIFNQQLDDVQIHPEHSHIIVAFSSNGNKIWQRNIGTKVGKVAFVDINNDENKEVLVATYKLNVSDIGEEPGWLFVFTEKGELITKHNIWKPSIYDVEEPKANIPDFQVADLDNDGRQEIVVITHGYQYHPSRLAILHYENKKFIEEKTYWNPGYLLQLYIEDVNNDSLPEIICVGVNNHFKHLPEYQVSHNVFSIFMLDSNSIFGQAPPYLGDNQIEKGSELWYRYLIPPSIEYDKSRIEDVTFKGDTEKLIYVKIQDTCFFYLNFAGEIVNRYQGEYCEGVTELLLVEGD